jgi:hypothetical protein
MIKKLSLESGFKEKVWTITDVVKHIEENLEDYYDTLVEKDLLVSEGYISLDTMGTLNYSHNFPDWASSYYTVSDEAIYGDRNAIQIDMLEGEFLLDFGECIWELVK